WLWRKMFVIENGYYEVETVSFLPEILLKASGHIGHFHDPIVTCSKCKKKFRADHLVGEKLGKKVEGISEAELAKLIEKEKIVCPDCKGALENVAEFNLMFKTNVGAAEGIVAYSRPETAQGIFMAFPRVFRFAGSKLPLAIAQIGHSFRNEISPRQGLMRMREFTQMELEYFFNPKETTHPKFADIAQTKIRFYAREEQETGSGKTDETTVAEAVKKNAIPNEIMGYFIALEQEFYVACGVPYEKFRFRHMLKSETPHYSGGNIDLEVETSYGWEETVGNAYRTDYDLAAHAKMSGKDLSVFIEGEGKLMPHVVEPSLGVDRLFWCILESCYREGGGAEKRDWSWFAFPPAIAPFDCAVLPLMKKDGLAEKAQEIAGQLRKAGLDVRCEESGSVGKRYARADEIGIPYCMTVDYQTKEDGTVTVRFRDDGKQTRVKVSELAETIRQYKREGKACL
ncbi:MAG: glycine--tRNA ligase, partial [Candidatus Micrarchaeota archaeon]|nr:glycine--tRNA ligase [Candidatus Micrarchaeota archaeon]